MILEYIWLDGKNNIRGKTKVLNNTQTIELEDVPSWNYDGSSTYQSQGHDSEVILRPCRLYNDPFRKGNNHIVLCDTWFSDQPHVSNQREKVVELFKKHEASQAPWYGIEQEFFMIDPKTKLPLGFIDENTAINGPQGPYYCGVGSSNCLARQIAESMLQTCLNIGLNITGLNFEVAPGQCELQLRERGLKAADDLIMMRYILQRVGELHNIDIDFSAKPVSGDWNGSGCHVNFSTRPMREENGYSIIQEAINKLESKHTEHIDVYGLDNHLRLTGNHETSSIDKFSSGVADRGASVRIPRSTVADNCGYFEDRRPSSSMDPYLVLSKLLHTICE